MLVHRLASAIYAADNAEGARIYGGRWNERGTPVIYTSPTVSLAAAEVMVHYGLIPADYRVINIVVPGHLQHMDVARLLTLPADWHEEASIPQTASIGTQWAESLLTPVLRVPCGDPNRVQLHFESTAPAIQRDSI